MAKYVIHYTRTVCGKTAKFTSKKEFTSVARAFNVVSLCGWLTDDYVTDVSIDEMVPRTVASLKTNKTVDLDQCVKADKGELE